MVSNIGPMVLTMKVNGSSIRLKEQVLSGMLKSMYIEATSKTIWQTDKENILISMEASIKESLKMMFKRAMERKNGLMELSM